MLNLDELIRHRFNVTPVSTARTVCEIDQHILATVDQLMNVYENNTLTPLFTADDLNIYGTVFAAIPSSTIRNATPRTSALTKIITQFINSRITADPVLNALFEEIPDYERPWIIGRLTLSVIEHISRIHAHLGVTTMHVWANVNHARSISDLIDKDDTEIYPDFTSIASYISAGDTIQGQNHDITITSLRLSTYSDNITQEILFLISQYVINPSIFLNTDDQDYALLWLEYLIHDYSLGRSIIQPRGWFHYLIWHNFPTYSPVHHDAINTVTSWLAMRIYHNLQEVLSSDEDSQPYLCVQKLHKNSTDMLPISSHLGIPRLNSTGTEMFIPQAIMTIPYDEDEEDTY